MNLKLFIIAVTLVQISGFCCHGNGRKRLMFLKFPVSYNQLLPLLYVMHVNLSSYLQQAALEKGKIVEKVVDGEIKTEEVLSAENLSHGSASTDSLTSQMNELSVSANPVVENPLSDANDPGDAGAPGQDIDKRIRAIKKKVSFIHGFNLGSNNFSKEFITLYFLLVLKNGSKYLTSPSFNGRIHIARGCY